MIGCRHVGGGLERITLLSDKRLAAIHGQIDRTAPARVSNAKGSAAAKASERGDKKQPSVSFTEGHGGQRGMRHPRLHRYSRYSPSCGQ
jgi:hypothetical protein